MKTINGLAATAASLALLATPVAASAATATNPAASLSVAKTRAATPTARGSKLGASVPTATLISIGVLAALVVGVLVATGGDDNSDSN
ncbi:hypothetical protein ACT009_07390 [Sphingomonas sp. Tas61C01]|uniref:hypothetical protein n=1 Tax=Sphingomonas sp. Tas61C01 TaxID=3458297 RepID=UPI00403EB521